MQNSSIAEPKAQDKTFDLEREAQVHSVRHQTQLDATRTNAEAAGVAPVEPMQDLPDGLEQPEIAPEEPEPAVMIATSQ